MAPETENILVLFIREEKHINLAPERQGLLDPPCVCLGVLRATAETHIYGELRHLEPLVEQEVTKAGCGLAVTVLHDRKVEHYDHPHQTVSREHLDWVLRRLAPFALPVSQV